jgi:hypothetical protein
MSKVPYGQSLYPHGLIRVGFVTVLIICMMLLFGGCSQDKVESISGTCIEKTMIPGDFWNSPRYYAHIDDGQCTHTLRLYEQDYIYLMIDHNYTITLRNDRVDSIEAD